VLLLLFLSGAAALIYQTLWIKQLSLVVGVDVYAVTTAVSGFFVGLALGGAIFGQLAEAASQPYRLYAWLEIGVAIAGVAVTFALSHAAEPFVALEARAALLPWPFLLVLIALPACLMGGTVPVLVRAVAASGPAVSQVGGRLYAANTLGAIAGVLLAPFVLIPWLGVRGSAGAAAALNIAAALLAAGARLKPRPTYVSAMRADIPPTAAPSAKREKARRAEAPAADEQRRAFLLYATAGAIALGYEVVWSHIIVQFVSTRAFAFSIVLATYLAGLAIGSAVYARVAHRVRDEWGAFGTLVALAGVTALLGVAMLGRRIMTIQSNVEDAMLAATGDVTIAMAARFAVAALGVVFVPCLLLGATFPAALQVASRSGRPARDTGWLLAVNTTGGVVGTLVTGFVLLPTFGSVRTLGALALAAGLTGLAATRRPVVISAAACAAVAAIQLPPDRLATLLTLNRGGQGTVLYSAEGAGGTVTVIEQRAAGASFRRLYIDGVSNSGDALTSQRYMRLQALLPLIIHGGEPKAAMVIGFGTGITTGALLPYEGLERRVCAELLPAVVHAAPFFRGTFDVAASTRVDIRLVDGRRELLRSRDSYDLITLEPPPPSARGVVNLYSRDFYELAKRRLAPGGVVAQWWPLPTQNTDDSRALVRAFLDAFPYASVWTTELHEMLLVGSTVPLRIDTEVVRARFNQPAVRQALVEVGVASPEALLSTWIGGRDQLDRFAGSVEAVTDDRPAIEYAPWVRPLELTRVLPLLLESSTLPPVVGADTAFAGRIAEARARLHTFYRAALAAYVGDQATAKQLMQEVLSHEAENPYYRWFVTGRAESRN
jgi:spermidine synthase